LTVIKLNEVRVTVCQSGLFINILYSDRVWDSYAAMIKVRLLFNTILYSDRVWDSYAAMIKVRLLFNTILYSDRVWDSYVAMIKVRLLFILYSDRVWDSYAAMIKVRLLFIAGNEWQKLIREERHISRGAAAMFTAIRPLNNTTLTVC
jgi:hypothetical protein